MLNGLAKGTWEGYISTLVLEELERAPNTVHDKIVQHLRRTRLAVLEETPESLVLARAYIAAGAIPPDYEDDARHIAVATASDIRVIVSWNFRHMVNIERKRRINSVNLREDYPLIDIVSPWEVSHEETRD